MNYWMNSIIPFGERSRRRANRGATNSQMMGLMGICGLGLGAGLMFMFDPDRGRRRRALARDQMAHAARMLARDGRNVPRPDSPHLRDSGRKRKSLPLRRDFGQRAHRSRTRPDRAFSLAPARHLGHGLMTDTSA